MSDPSFDVNVLRTQIRSALVNSKAFAGPIGIRLAWHASGTFDKSDNTGGSNGSTMRFEPESTDGANAGLDITRSLLEPVFEANPNVSRADVWTLAGALCVEFMGGPQIPFNFGRVDHADGAKCPANGRLPDAAQGAQHLRDVFYRMGFNDREIVALSGAHTVGRCHLSRSGFDGPWTNSPLTFNNAYFKHILEYTWEPKKWDGPLQYEDKETGKLMMLPTDIALRDDPEFKKFVEIYAADEATFFADYAVAMGKLLALGCPAPCAHDAPAVCPVLSAADKAGAEFREAAMHGSILPVKKLKTAENINSQDKCSGRTAMHKAAFWGHADTIAFLVSEGADANIVDNEGDSALHDAARLNQSACVAALIKAGADKSIVNKAGQTAATIAAANKNEWNSAMLK